MAAFENWASGCRRSPVDQPGFRCRSCDQAWPPTRREGMGTRMRLRPTAITDEGKGGDRLPQTASDRGGHALRAPSPLHAFNRYEIKYLVPTSRLTALREQ